MKTNPWQKDFTKASIISLYVSPIVHSTGVILVAVLLSWLFRRLGWLGEDNWLLTFFMVLLTAILSTVLYYVFHLNAKIDMLKRTVDPAAREKDTRMLWVEGTFER